MNPPAIPLRPECATWLVVLIAGPPGDIDKSRGEVVLDTAQSCARLGFTPGYLYELARKGRIAAVMKTPRGYLFSERDVEALRVARGG